MDGAHICHAFKHLKCRGVLKMLLRNYLICLYLDNGR